MPSSFKIFICWLVMLLIALNVGIAQTNSCPTNIGFENGDFNSWNCYTGKINSAGEINVAGSQPINGNHSIFKNENPQQLDPYGKFPVNCPNGSGYSIKLGNESTAAAADRISYSFTIPANRNEYSIIYHYAVVFQNPNHLEHQQPRFTAKIFDETEGKYIDCGSFEFVASSGLPGFSLSTLSANVYYKPWSPVTIKLMGYAGKNIRLEFTTNDCTLGGHFGYAYLDVDENCTSPITGNVFCPNNKDVTLVAPFGFAQYRWFDASFSKVLGTSNSLKLTPLPANNTVFAVELTPYPGLGCLDTVYTTIVAANDRLNLQLRDSVFSCDNKGVDITQAFITNGSTPNLKFSYFTDSEATIPISTPKDIKTNGTYYIKATNLAGCSEVKSLVLAFTKAPLLRITDPPIVCSPSVVNLTDKNIVLGSDQNLTYSYWRTEDTLTVLEKPDSVKESRTYFIKATHVNGCSVVSKVKVTIEDLPMFDPLINKYCATANLQQSIPTFLNNKFVFTFYSDSSANNRLINFQQINQSGRYFIKATSTNGCIGIKGLNVDILPIPNFTIKDSLKSNLPTTIDISDAIINGNNHIFSYWKDSATTVEVSKPNTINESGRYYIKATDNNGCTQTKSIYLNLIPPPPASVEAPNVFSPNKDGINDVFKLKIIGYIGTFQCNIYNRSGQIVFTTNDPLFQWKGTLQNGKELPVGIYYWVVEMKDSFRNTTNSQTGSITILK